MKIAQGMRRMILEIQMIKTLLVRMTEAALSPGLQRANGPVETASSHMKI